MVNRYCEDTSFSLGEPNGNTTYLSEIKLSLLFVGYTLDLDERGVRFGIALAASMAQDTALSIRPKTTRKRI